MRFLGLCVLAGLLSIMPAYAVDVTTCGQEVAAGDTGVLTGDLVCDGTTPGICLCGNASCYVDPDTTCASDGDCSSNFCVRNAVRLRNPSNLDLNGFSISGAPGDPPYHGVFCEGRCTIAGPGTVTGMGREAIHVGDRAGVGRLTANDVTASNSHAGISAIRMKLRNVVATGNELGLDVRALRADATDVSGNTGAGIRATRMSGTGITTSNNGLDGVITAAARLRNFTSLDNGRWGLWSSSRGTLVDSTLTGNGLADVGTANRPRLRNTTCGTSAMADPQSINTVGGTWGVCQGD